MNLTVDIGNTYAKWATVSGGTVVATGEGLPAADVVAGAEGLLACASGEAPAGMPLLTAATPLPLRLDYRTPATLGADRIAAACGAWSLHWAEASVVVDAGTCITVDFVDAQGTYHGGAIMPGLGMSLAALHERTARLPLVSLDGVGRAPVMGRSTEECIVAGTLGATMLALAGYVALYRQRCPRLNVLLTGGDAGRLRGEGGWEWQPHLTHIGLDAIIDHNKRGI